MGKYGKKAVDVLWQASFDIVLMDLQMPIMNGYEAAANIRESERSHEMHTPIIAMTAFATKGDRKKCLEAGMDDYLSKPVDVDEFLDVVEKWTRVIVKKPVLVMLPIEDASSPILRMILPCMIPPCMIPHNLLDCVCMILFKHTDLF